MNRLSDVKEQHNRTLRILQVSQSDLLGGAEKVAWKLFQIYGKLGLDSWLAVGSKKSNDPKVFEIPNKAYRTFWKKMWLTAYEHVKFVPKKPFAWLAEPKKIMDRYFGIILDDFDYPATRHILKMVPHKPDVLHCHNLHGSYFDLRALPELSRDLPVVLTLHDMWLLTGGCTHSLDCNRWIIGCGKCPILTNKRENVTAYEWRRKQSIYSPSLLHIVTPSRWLMEKVKRSMLRSVDYHVIPNGVDLSIFRPFDHNIARDYLALPKDTSIILFVSQDPYSPVRDFPTLQEAVQIAASKLNDRRVLLVCLGGKPRMYQVGRAKVVFIGYVACEEMVAHFYQAADLCVHATLADNLPTVLMESLACGTPVVASEVGGIPEIVKDGETGFLTPIKDPHAMADRIIDILSIPKLRRELSVQAVEVAQRRFDLNRQADEYVGLYEKAIG